MKEADIFVFLDNVQYERQSWQCRNRIKGPSKQPIWLTIPVNHDCLYEEIRNVKIAGESEWEKKHWNSIRSCYGRAPYFEVYSAFFKSVYEKRWSSLSELNIHLIKYLASQLGLSPIFVNSSQLNPEGKRTRLVLDICQSLNASRYLSSIGAEEYMKADNAKELFEKEKIRVEFLEYNHPRYPQLFGEFIPDLSVVDCLFNCGPNSSKVLFADGSASIHALGR